MYHFLTSHPCVLDGCNRPLLDFVFQSLQRRLPLTAGSPSCDATCSLGTLRFCAFNYRKQIGSCNKLNQSESDIYPPFGVNNKVHFILSYALQNKQNWIYLIWNWLPPDLLGLFSLLVCRGGLALFQLGGCHHNNSFGELTNANVSEICVAEWKGLESAELGDQGELGEQAGCNWALLLSGDFKWRLFELCTRLVLLESTSQHHIEAQNFLSSLFYRHNFNVDPRTVLCVSRCAWRIRSSFTDQNPLPIVPVCLHSVAKHSPSTANAQYSLKDKIPPQKPGNKKQKNKTTKSILPVHSTGLPFTLESQCLFAPISSIRQHNTSSFTRRDRKFWPLFFT